MNRKYFPAAGLAVVIAAAAIGTVAAQGFTSARVVETNGYISFDKVHPGSGFRLAVVADIKETWHVNAHEPSLEYLIATAVEFEETPGLKLGDAIYPPFEELSFSFTGGQTLRVYEGRVPIGLEATAARDLTPGQHLLKGTLTVQACNDTSCLAPARIPVEIAVTIASPGEPINAIHNEIFSAIQFAGGAFPVQGETLAEPAAGTGAENTVSQWVEERGWAFTLAVIFLGGLGLNLTPCVYPLIPITLAYFGGQAAGKPGRTFAMAATYVLGMCATYSGLGVLAATTGGILGSILQNPIALIFVALVLVALGLSMMGLYDIQVPLFLRNRISSKSGFGGALFMGLTVGLVAAPCVGPFVVALLAYVGQVGSPVLGFWLFFVLALGLGLPYLFLGGFTGAATGLPRAGAWMVWVKKVFGWIMFAMAVYFVNPLLPDTLSSYSIPAILGIAGLYLGFVERSPIRTRGFRVARLSTAGVCALLAVMLLMPANASQGVEWDVFSTEALQQALDEGRPVLIDFTAEWCLPCKELDHFTFTDPRVVAGSRRFVRLKADITSQVDEAAAGLQKKYDLMGAPTIVFIDSTGRERTDLRLTGFEKADKFLDRMNQVQ